MVVPIGFSTGCIIDPSVSLIERIELFSKMGADAIEVRFRTADDLIGFGVDRKELHEVCGALEGYEFLGLHAPWVDGIRYKEDDNHTNRMLEKLNILKSLFDTRAIVMHINSIECEDLMNGLEDFPFAIENEDPDKRRGYTPEAIELAARNMPKAKFVLDLLHSYNYNPSMYEASRMRRIIGNRLSHVHLSGTYTDELHYPVHLSDNRDVMLNALDMVEGVPIILEGALRPERGNVRRMVVEELECVRDYVETFK